MRRFAKGMQHRYELWVDCVVSEDLLHERAGDLEGAGGGCGVD